ncbi:hypothetical protein [Nocardioides sp. SLBN-35]|uniref:hypothetical protein n=1 Tax=Nocardioides sp. SLBN-35 TaxID=2768445 RepID=UPI00114DE416|nr:hypothetical protein [Nocardioides sp. SLBN-35]TQK69677.1 hypothetical protein FBY23_1443 [Nocardioides sp. SLBN-35]
MDFYETTTWSAVLLTLLLALLVFGVAGVVRAWTVQGSVARYRWASIERATMYPGLVGLLLRSTEALARHDYVGLGLWGSLAGVTAWNISRIRNDDDDHWFKDLGRRLGRLAHYAAPP